MIIHELVNYGRHMNHLPQMVDGFLRQDKSGKNMFLEED
jgi:hypothetical protein